MNVLNFEWKEKRKVRSGVEGEEVKKMDTYVRNENAKMQSTNNKN